MTALEPHSLVQQAFGGYFELIVDGLSHEISLWNLVYFSSRIRVLILSDPTVTRYFLPFQDFGNQIKSLLAFIRNREVEVNDENFIFLWQCGAHFCSLPLVRSVANFIAPKITFENIWSFFPQDPEPWSVPHLVDYFASDPYFLRLLLAQRVSPHLICALIERSASYTANEKYDVAQQMFMVDPSVSASIISTIDFNQLTDEQIQSITTAFSGYITGPLLRCFASCSRSNPNIIYQQQQMNTPPNFQQQQQTIAASLLQPPQTTTPPGFEQLQQTIAASPFAQQQTITPPGFQQQHQAFTPAGFQQQQTATPHSIQQQTITMPPFQLQKTESITQSSLSKQNPIIPVFQQTPEFSQQQQISPPIFQKLETTNTIFQHQQTIAPPIFQQQQDIIPPIFQQTHELTLQDRIQKAPFAAQQLSEEAYPQKRKEITFQKIEKKSINIENHKHENTENKALPKHNIVVVEPPIANPNVSLTRISSAKKKSSKEKTVTRSISLPDKPVFSTRIINVDSSVNSFVVETPHKAKKREKKKINIEKEKKPKKQSVSNSISIQKPMKASVQIEKKVTGSSSDSEEEDFEEDYDNEDEFIIKPIDLIANKFPLNGLFNYICNSIGNPIKHNVIKMDCGGTRNRALKYIVDSKDDTHSWSNLTKLGTNSYSFIDAWIRLGFCQHTLKLTSYTLSCSKPQPFRSQPKSWTLYGANCKNENEWPREEDWVIIDTRDNVLSMNCIKATGNFPIKKEKQSFYAYYKIVLSKCFAKLKEEEDKFCLTKLEFFGYLKHPDQ